MSREVHRNQPNEYQFPSEIRRDTFYDFRKVVKNKVIDPRIGRNNMFALLRVNGILSKHNKPKNKTPWTRYFRWYIVGFSDIRNLYKEVFLISGEGVIAIRELIESIRTKGGSI